jgi:type IX secretion system PorP/SprF family membrane protein
MKLIRHLIIPVAALMWSSAVNAQYDPLFTQFMYNEMFINPGFAGSRDAMSATLLNRQQWMNFPGRPVTTTFSVHGPLCLNKMGLGLSVLNEKIGVLNRNLVYGSYAYRIRLGKGHLGLGISAGLHNQSQRFADLKASRDGAPDPQLAQNVNLTSFNFGAGLYYSTRTFYAGASVPRFINDAPAINGDAISPKGGVSVSALHYYLMLGKVFEFKNHVALKTQAMLKSVAGAPLQADVNANLLLMQRLWIGAGYRTGSAASALLGIQITPQLFAGYSYDFDLTAMQGYHGGSHEIVLSYLFMFDLKKVLSPRYF